MGISIINDRNRRLIISGSGNEVEHVSEGVKPEVVEYVLSMQPERQRIVAEISEAAKARDNDRRKALMREHQNLAFEIDTKAKELQFG